MIQRVQSIYLLCSIIFMAIFAFTPYCNIVTDSGSYQLNSCGLNLSAPIETAGATITSSQNFTVAILAALISVMSAVAIFMFKNRPRQILVCKVNILLYIALYIVMGIYAYNNYNILQGTGFTTTTYVIFPICALITNWLAMGAIKKDEDMVRDSERMWSRSK